MSALKDLFLQGVGALAKAANESSRPRAAANTTTVGLRRAEITADNGDGSYAVKVLDAGCGESYTVPRLRPASPTSLAVGATVMLAWEGPRALPYIVPLGGGALPTGEFVTVRSYEPSGFQGD